MSNSAKRAPFELLITEHENGGFTLQSCNGRQYEGSRLGAFSCPRHLLDHLDALLIPAPIPVVDAPDPLREMVHAFVKGRSCTGKFRPPLGGQGMTLDTTALIAAALFAASMIVSALTASHYPPPPLHLEGFAE